MPVSPYNRIASFTTAQQAAPTTPLPGDQLDAELNAIKGVLDNLISRLAQIQRDDGALANASVGRLQLNASISLGFQPPTAWASPVNYQADINTVFFSGKFYRCALSHLSSVFATDLAAGRWTLIADFSGTLSTAINLGFTPTGNITSTNTQAAVAEVQSHVDTLTALGITQNPPVAPTQAGTDNTTKVATTAFVQSVATSIAQSIADKVTPIGTIKMWGGYIAPTGWAFCDGSEYLRSNTALWNAIGQNWGGGNGTTTANLPDFRGCAPVGLDMAVGGIYADRVTIGGAGMNTRTLNTLGGEQTHILSGFEMPVHSHGVNDPGHTHNILTLDQQPGGGSVINSSFLNGGSFAHTTQSNTTGITTQNSGGSGAHNNVQPSRCVPFIIRVS